MCKLKIAFCLIGLLSSTLTLAQNLDCQLLKEEILSQRRQELQQENQTQQYGSAGLFGSPSLAPFYAQAAQQGQLIGQGVGAALGVPTLQQKIQMYKQKCE
jgi:hypothetical protein